MELIQALKQGDQLVFARIFDLFHQKAFGFFMNRLDKDRELAKELTQLCFIKLWQSRHSLSEQHSLDRQLFTIAKTTLIDFIRKESRKSKLRKVIERNQEGVVRMQEEGISGFEQRDYLSQVLHRLPPARKKILQLKYLYGYSNREIADQLSISIKTVEDHVTKGLHELKLHSQLPVVFCLFFLVASPVLA